MKKETLAEHILHQLNHSFNLIRRERHSPENRGGGVQRGQGRLIRLLMEHGTLTQHELSELLQIRPASLGELVVKLEHKGYVERRPNARDKRRIDVLITAAGRQKAAEIETSRHDLAEDLLKGLSLDEQAHLAGLMDKLVLTLETRPNDHEHEGCCHGRHC